MTDIKILGHSGCTVEVVENFDDICIRKSTRNLDYINRLKEQIAKQKKFSKTFKSAKVPAVYGEYQSPRLYYAEMEYIAGLDIFSFIDLAGKDQLDRFFCLLESFLTESIAYSQLCDFPILKIQNKLDSLEKDLSINLPCAIVYIDRLRTILNYESFSKIPIGFCHGDLTFSNILIESECENLFFIDFLDSFIETPLQDIVKIKQDVVYYWSVQKVTTRFDLCRAKMSFTYINKKLDKFITNNSIDNSVLSVLQAVNFMRILPYTNDVNLIKYIFNCIDSELKKLES